MARDRGKQLNHFGETMPTTHSGFIIQSDRPGGDFELVVADPVNARLAHCRRNNEDPELSWVGPQYFGGGSSMASR